MQSSIYRQQKESQRRTVSISQNLPKGFSYLNEIAPTIQSDLRYCSSQNFLGISVNGYNEDVVITSTKTAEALYKVQAELIQQDLSLKIFDAYRPQTAVNHFVYWARQANDTLMKQEYYPKLNTYHLKIHHFDVDFCQDRREETIRYVQQKYG